MEQPIEQTPSNEKRPEQVLAMAYVPVQRLQSVYEPEAGFRRGTIFPDLDKPFCMAGGERR